ncbi:Stage II sporulation protein E (SpoIIE) [Micromonospora halophytica]|uniref:Stage II sporulation protein E (SpoIIE) n=1 Tax=Micromonospora halophytica TaxID=47864 RepID=A0A1C5IVM2_9ACTN|nr:Stage II sporulation protein E (SpoIIE) [Micromonospora halophytica]
MRLAAEMLRAQLPPLTFSTGSMTISGILEPSYDVGGDAFDYAVNGDTAHLALFDAVGHGSGGGMRAVMLASLALAAYRNTRRAGRDLIATYHHIDTAVRDHDRRGLITGVLAELDQRTGRLRVISAGHPSGLVLRRGKVATVLPTPTALPVPLGEHRAPVVVEEALEPGDDVLFYTDGIIEARSGEASRSASTGWSTSPCGPSPTTCRWRRPPGGWCTRSWRTRTTSSATTPRCCWSAGTVRRAGPHRSGLSPPPGSGRRTRRAGRCTARHRPAARRSGCSRAARASAAA